MKPIDALSFQMYSARTLEPLEKQFELLAGLGYKMVEPFGGQFGDVPKLKRLLDQHHMSAPSAHIGMDRMRADLKGVIAMCRSIDVKTVFAPAPMMDERGQDGAGWQKLGRELSGMCKIANGEGLAFGWHNHHWEYGKGSDGKRFIDMMFHEAPDMVWEADLAWIVRGAADPVAELARYGSRVVACHIKDIAAPGQALDEDGWADPGHGVMDWVALLAAIKKTACKLFVVEHDKPNDVARFARRARDTVAGWK